MRRTIGLGDTRCERRFALSPRHFSNTCDPDFTGFGRQNKLRLPRPDQIDIDFREKLGVKQRAVLGAP